MPLLKLMLPFGKILGGNSVSVTFDVVVGISVLFGGFSSFVLSNSFSAVLLIAPPLCGGLRSETLKMKMRVYCNEKYFF